ncbi:anaerobic C4-dicarboxylate transporter [Salmonella enterica subsp. enterica]|uniref:C4-dicarboxylate transporter DcuA n=1 Tax=Salmonella enterica I TaxID=59201 RepID=A0A447PW84_SALET|nr:anaerobic C4-dicarboxylate transporter [Salmonella enterica subsp. enterica]
MPMALALNVSPLTAVASFAAVSGLFILPTYPTLVAAVQMDDTGTTRIGKFVFNHPFFIPGTLGVVLAVCFGFPAGQLYAVSVSPAGRITPRILPPFD